MIISGSKEQGKLNDLNYIFKNIINNKILGLEIISWKWNIFHSFKKLNK